MTIEDLQIQINKLKSRGRNWLIALGVAIVLAVVLLITVFKPKQRVDPRIDALEDQIEHLKKSNQFIDSLIAEKDTLYIENRKTETKIIERYERIPIDVRALDREQLRREVSNY